MIIPSIRFSEFHENYVIYSLSEIFDRVKRKNTPIQTDIPLTIASIEGLVDQRSYFGKTVASEDLSGYYLLKKGEFAYNKSYSKGFPVGSIKRLDKYNQGALSTLYICFAIKKDINISSNYLAQYFNSSAWYEAVNYICAEGARNHGLLNVSPDDFFETTHYLAPTIKEQNKVADFLSLFDRKLENQQSKINALEMRKRSISYQIFEGELRFRANNGSKFPNWDSIVIDESFDSISDKRHSDKTVLTIIQGNGTVPRNASGRNISYDKSTIDNYKLVQKDDFIMHLRSFEGGLEIATCEGIVSPAYTILRSKIDIVPDFYRYYFRSSNFVDGKLARITEGIRDGRSINMDDFWILEIPYPSIEEQQKIADFLGLLDKQIRIEKEKLDAIKQVKKGLLQQMFV